ncbi:MAG: glycosyltransferase family 2 protein [bacterium]
MSQHPLISVCTPVYNGGALVAECIKGVLAQRYPNFEYIIVDNASTDRTAEIIDSLCAGDERVKVFRNEKTVDVIDNFRTCVSHISPEAKWIKYALADDYLYENCLEEMLRVGEQSGSVGLVSAFRLYGGQLTNVGLSPEKSVYPGAEILKKQAMRSLHVCSGSPNTVMYRRSAYDALGGFDNTYLHADTELAFRLLDNYDLGFAHCVFTRTGLHGGRQENRSISSGRMLREYMDFGFSNLDRYSSLEMAENEKDKLAGWYARRVVEFLAKKTAHLDGKHIRTMLENCPSPIRKKLARTSFKHAGPVMKTFFRELVRTIKG